MPCKDWASDQGTSSDHDLSYHYKLSIQAVHHSVGVIHPASGTSRLRNTRSYTNQGPRPSYH